MHNQKSSLAFGIALAIFSASLLMSPNYASAQTETVLHSFNSADDAAYDPTLSVVFDSKGNLYGTTQCGGVPTFLTCPGAVYELQPVTGGWHEKTLYYFNNSDDGESPVAGVVLDSHGNLYGTTLFGGTNSLGVVYELVLGSDGNWTESVLHKFAGYPNDGSSPRSALIFDSAGNLYGTTSNGGTSGNGAVYELSPQSDGTWNETILYSFGPSPDGASSGSSVIFDSAGNLYGTTNGGGANQGGTVYELSPNSTGGWTEKILYNFPASSEPWAKVVFDSKGNLYGTTVEGGVYGWGSVWELLPQSDGTWAYRTLHNFSGQSDGGDIISNLIFDSANNLYGAALAGGADWAKASGGYGDIFKLAPAPGGDWDFNVVFSFDDTDGTGPAVGGLTLDSAGNLYGAAEGGGSLGHGVVFEVTP
jgi:uncharacterized repeat protein (TIGR03803 family)